MTACKLVRWLVALCLCLCPAPASAFRTTADAPGFDGVAARWSVPSVGFYFCSRARLTVDPGTDPLTQRDGFAKDAGSMVVV